MSTIDRGVAGMSNDELLMEVTRLARRECEATAALIASLAELDARRLYLREGCASLFTYCTERLHLSEGAAYHRIEAARAGRRFPLILERLERGQLTLSAVVLLAPHLTGENHAALLDAARHQSKRAIERFVASLHSRPDVACSVRKLPPPRAQATPVPAAWPSAAAACPGPAPRTMEQDLSLAQGLAAPARATASPASSAHGQAPKENLREAGAQGEVALLPEAAGTTIGLTMVGAAGWLPSRPALVRPLAPARYQVTMTVSEETHAKLRRAQNLLRHVIPNGDPAAVFDRALTLLIRDLEKTKIAALARPARHKDGPRRRPRIKTEGPTKGKAETGSSGASAVGMSAPGCATPSSPGAAPRSRHIPAGVKRAVWARDGGQCAFVGTAGRCSERGFIEFHHRVPWAAGGIATAGNIELRCRAHNLYEAADGMRPDVAQAWQARKRVAEETRAASQTDGREGVCGVPTRPGAS